MADMATLIIRIPTDQVKTAAERLKELRIIGERTEDTLNRTSRGATRANRSFLNLGRSVRQLAGAYVSLVAAQRAFRVIADFEQGMVRVQATTELADRQIARLSARIFDVGEKLGTPVQEMTKIAAAAGQLGIRSVEHLGRFVETMSRLSIATDLHGENAVLILARLITITGAGLENVDRLASVITRLGNEFAALEPEIAQASLRVAQSTAGFKISAAEVVAFGTALKTVGVVAELGGSSIGRTFNKMEQAVIKAGLELKFFAEIARTTPEEFSELFRQAPVEAFVKFAEGLRGITEEGLSTQAALRAVGVEGIRDFFVLRPLTSRIEVLTNALRVGGDEWQKNAELIRESARASDTLKAEWGRLEAATTRLLTNQKGLAVVLRDTLVFLRQMVQILSFNRKAYEESSETVKAYLNLLFVLWNAAREIGSAILDLIGTLFNMGKALFGAEKQTISFADILDHLARSARFAADIIKVAFKTVELILGAVILTIGLGISKLLGGVAAVKEFFTGSATGIRALQEDVNEFNRKIKEGIVETVKEGTTAFENMVTSAHEIFSPIRGREIGRKFANSLIEALNEAEFTESAKQLRFAFSEILEARAGLSAQPLDVLLREARGRLRQLHFTVTVGLEGPKKQELESVREAIERDLALFEQNTIPLSLKEYGTLLSNLEENLRRLSQLMGADEGAIFGHRGPREVGPSGKTDKDFITDLSPFAVAKAQMEAELEALKLVGPERERYLALQKLELDTRKQKLPFLKAEAEEFDKLFKTLQDARFLDQFNEKLEEEIELLRAQHQALFLTNEESERFLERKRLEMELRKNNITGMEAELGAYEKTIEALQQAEKTKKLFEDIGNSAGDAFAKMATGAEKVGEAVRALILDIIRLSAQKFIGENVSALVSTGLQNLFARQPAAPSLPQVPLGPPQFQPVPTTGFQYNFNARGNVIRDARVVPFAKGGIIDMLTEFQMADGRRGRAGERGPEGAIFPLSRDSSGNLGVRVVGGGGRGRTVHDNRQYHFHFPPGTDVKGIRKAQHQMIRELRGGGR